MSISVEVVLLSGKRKKLYLDADTPLELVRKQSQDAFQFNGKLMTSAGEALSGATTVTEAGLKDGDILTLTKQPVSVAASASAFAAVLSDGSVVTWGDPASGGDSGHMQNRLVNVQQLRASETGFAAILADGSLVAWGGVSEEEGCIVPKGLRNVAGLLLADFTN